MRRIAVLVVIFGAAYTLFAGSASWSELVAGVGAVGAATSYVVVLHRARARSLALRAPWARVLGRPLVRLLPDAWRVGGVLLRALHRRPAGEIGVLQRQAFDVAGTTPGDAGRRGVVTLALSLAPNGYVLDLLGDDDDREDGALLHQLMPAATDANRRWPA